MRYLLLTFALPWMLAFAQSADSLEASPLRVTLHDSSGLTSASAPEHHLYLNLFKSHTHIHVRISNLSGQVLTLWQPNCPEGDNAIVVEFRDPASPMKVFRARPGWGYTGGMGIPKVFTLASHDDIIVNLDFMSDVEWRFPMHIPKDATRELEVRVGYRSQNLTEEEAKKYGISKDIVRKPDPVWEGEIMGNWQKISARNASGKPIGPKQ